MSDIHWKVAHPDPSLINDDFRPASPEERHWSVGNIASLWVGMVVCVYWGGSHEKEDGVRHSA